MKGCLAKKFLRVHWFRGQKNPEREPPIGLSWVAVGSLALLALLILLFHLELTVQRNGRAVFTFDSAEYAVAGRQISRTGVLNTTFAYLDDLSGSERPPFPYPLDYPMVPFLNGAMFFIGGERPALTLIPPGLFYLLLVSLAAMFAFQLSRSRALALCVGCTVAIHPVVLRFASEGLTEMPFTAAWIGAVFLLWQMPQRPRPFILGLVLGLAHLTRPVIAPLIPVWLVAAALMVPSKRWRVIGAMLAGFLPWPAIFILYRFITTGDPMVHIAPNFLLPYLAPEFGAGRLHQCLDLPPPLAYLSDHPTAFFRKILRFGPSMMKQAFGVGSPFIGMLFLIHLFSPVKRTEDKVFRISLALFLIISVGLVTITYPDGRYFVPFLPLLLILGLSELYLLMRARGLRGSHTIGICVTIVVIVFALPTVHTWWDAWRPREPGKRAFTETEWIGFGDRLRRVLPEHAVVTSDVASWLAWYADCPSVLLPATPAQLEALEGHLTFDAIVLTNQALLRYPGNEEWLSLFFGEETLEHWIRTDSISVGRLQAVVLLRTNGRRGAIGYVPRCPAHAVLK